MNTKSSSYPVQKTEAEWRQLLQAKGAERAAFEVTRHAATERPFSGKFEGHWAQGSYHCICCNAKLFDANSKFDAGCGWPSFSVAAADQAIEELRDHSHGMIRTETRCAQCGAHLGHVFEDGPAPTGLRYCMNSAALDFHPDSE